jgi:hypothetical protein
MAMNLPTDAAGLRAHLDRKRRHKAAVLQRNGLVRVLIRTDVQLELLAAAVTLGLAQAKSCCEIARTLPKWADENLVRAFIRGVGLEASLVRKGTWAQYHDRKAANGEAYTCRRGRSLE